VATEEGTVSKKVIWYKLEYHHGPGHQSTTTEYLYNSEPLTDEELEDGVERVADAKDLSNWSCTPEVIDKPPQAYIDRRIRVALARIEDGVDELRTFGDVTHAWSKMPAELRNRLARTIDMHLSRLRSITHEHTETFTYAQVREWSRSACVLYLMDAHGGVE
jgi:hypothetical protein